MPQLATVTPEGLTLRRELAGAGSRFAAAACDGLLLVLGYVALMLVIFLIAQADPTGMSGFVAGVLAGGFLLCLILYLFLAHQLLDGQSPGKQLFGLRVLSADGFPASATQVLLRSLLWPIDVFFPIPMPFFGLLGVVVMSATAHRQRIGDLVAGTVVVRERAPGAARAAPRGPAQQATAALALPGGILARLDEEDGRFLRDLLARQGLDPAVQGALLRRSAAHFAERLELRLQPSDDPRFFLRALHAELVRARGL